MVIPRLEDKILACWLGKNIGGTLGGPHEGQPAAFDLQFYDPVPTRVLENDDLDLQVVSLHHLLVGQHQTVTPAILAEAWQRHVLFPYDEYGVARRNRALGLIGPLQGAHDNVFGECMGAAIRSELWACVAAGDPARAAGLAWADAVVDHCGDGVRAEIFHAALQAAAFVETDRERLLDIAFAYVPASTRLGEALRNTRAWCQAGGDWRTLRDRVVDHYSTGNFTDVVCNLCFELIGWYAGEGDFGRSICIAVGCGLDTDCTGATLGALLGILNPDAIPDDWRRPIGEDVVLSPQIIGVACPRDLRTLTEWTLRLREQLRSFTPPVGEVLPCKAPDEKNAVRLLACAVSTTTSKDPLRRLALPTPGTWKPAPRSGHWWRLQETDFADDVQLYRLFFEVDQTAPVKVMAFYLPGVSAWVDGMRVIAMGPGDLQVDPYMAPSFHRAGRAAYTFDFRPLTRGRHELVLAVARPPRDQPADLVIGLGDAASNLWLPHAFLTT